MLPYIVLYQPREVLTHNFPFSRVQLEKYFDTARLQRAPTILSWKSYPKQKTILQRVSTDLSDLAEKTAGKVTITTTCK